MVGGGKVLALKGSDTKVGFRNGVGDTLVSGL